MRYRLLAVGLIFGFACGDAGPSSNQQPPADAGTNDSALVVEVGTGASGFEPMEDGDRLELVMAPQTGGGLGIGFHFNVSVRTKGLDPSGATVHLTVTRTRDGETLSDVTQQVNLVSVGDAHVGAGFRAVIPACYEVADETLQLGAEVTDANGESGSDERSFVGPMFCPR